MVPLSRTWRRTDDQSAGTAAGFQYIVTMNSDALPREGFQRGFDVGTGIMDTKLTDATDTGGLFGLRFE
jgi:uncharacterized protein YydD (DUF2326 family)